MPEHAPLVDQVHPPSAAQVVAAELALQGCAVPKHAPLGYRHPGTVEQKLRLYGQAVLLGVPAQCEPVPPSIAAPESMVPPVSTVPRESTAPPSTAPPVVVVPPVFLVPLVPVVPPLLIFPLEPVVPPVLGVPLDELVPVVPPAPPPPTPPPAVPPVDFGASAAIAPSFRGVFVLPPQPLPTSDRVLPQMVNNQR